MAGVRVFVTYGRSRRSIARALREYLTFMREHPDDGEMLASTVSQIRAELRRRREVNRELGWSLRQGWTPDEHEVAQ